MLLIGDGGEQLGVKPLPDALAIARARELDLVEVAPNANPPVCRLMDFKRYEYEQQQRRKESRRKATQVVIKEMKFRPKIDVHDYTTKMRHVERFLAEGNKVKLTIMFRGREMAHPELGLRILERIADEVSELAMVEILAPTRRTQHDDGPPSHQAHRFRRSAGGTRLTQRGTGEGNPTGRGGENPRRDERQRRHPTRRGEPHHQRGRGGLMPKQKTHRGAAKRFRITGTGKIRRRKSYRSHLLEKKSSRRTRRLGRPAEVTGGDKKHVERLLRRA